MHYADTSFMVSLVAADAGTEAVTSVFRAMGRRQLAFTNLHQMEVRNALRRLEFTASQELPAKLRDQARARRLKAEARLATYLTRKVFVIVQTDWLALLERFAELSEAHTTRLGTRTMDILHVAFALEAGCKEFNTCDIRQAALAKAAGLKVRLVEIDE